MFNWIDIRQEIPWLGMESMYFVNESAEEILTHTLSRLGFSIVILEGERITGEGAFFSEVSSVLRFPPHFGKNWDAFADSLGELAYLPERRQAVIWRHASVSLKANLYVFVKAAHELLNAAADLGRSDSPEPKPVQMEIFFVGEAPDFNKQP
jgi:hypothetical protein